MIDDGIRHPVACNLILFSQGKHIHDLRDKLLTLKLFRWKWKRKTENNKPTWIFYFVTSFDYILLLSLLYENYLTCMKIKYLPSRESLLCQRFVVKKVLVKLSKGKRNENELSFATVKRRVNFGCASLRICCIKGRAFYTRKRLPIFLCMWHIS